MGEIILGGRYIIENEIGTGGMAIVYKAHDNLLNRKVAVKVLRPEFKQDEDFIKRFDIEAKSAAGLNHPNIVAIHDVGVHEGLRYIVMEFIEGVTLKDYIAGKGKLPWRVALKFASQICSALSHAHARKIIHRDIKPHNIMVTKDGSLKVMDFGIARATSASTMTIGAKVLGSAHYLSPEQARGGFTDERSDLYSLGVCLYEMVTGKVPFDAETTVAVAMQHLQKDPEPPSVYAEELPSSVEYIILKAMRKEQSQRYLSAKNMESDIMRVLADSDVELSDDEEGSFYSTKQMDIIDDADIEEASKKDRKVKKKKGSIWLIALALLLGVGAAVSVLAYRYMQHDDIDPMMPGIIGLKLEEAEERLKLLDGEISVIVKNRVYSLPEEKDKIISQEPEEGLLLPGTKEVYVIIGRGEEEFEMESYVGDKLEDVKAKIRDAGLICMVEEENDDDLSEKYDEGRITRQSPSPGTVIRVGDTVTVYVSIGEENVRPKVPEVENFKVGDAKKVLDEAGYKNIKIETEESRKEKDTVLKQHPEGGERARLEEVIVLTVAIPEEKEDISGIVSELEGENDEEKKKTEHLTFSIPDGAKPVEVKVIRKDNGENVYSGIHAPLDSVTVEVRVSGPMAYELWIDDTLMKEMRVQG